MHLVESQSEATKAAFAPFAAVPLTVVLADGEAIAEVRDSGRGTIPLEPPFHVSDDDVYLVLPVDIGVEIADILRDGDDELLDDALTEGLLVVGAMVKKGRGLVELQVEHAITPAGALAGGMPYAAQVEVGGDGDPVHEANELDHVQCTMLSALVDDEGLEQMLRRDAFVGTSWRVPAHERERLVGVEPTYAWSRRLGPGRVGIELALFVEEEEMVVVLRPVELVAA
jgi:hypothetical protein